MSATIKGAATELGTERIRKLLMQYAVPAIIAMTASSLYNMVDSIFIGHGVGALAISGLALTMPLMNLASAFGAMVAPPTRRHMTPPSPAALAGSGDGCAFQRAGALYGGGRSMISTELIAQVRRCLENQIVDHARVAQQLRAALRSVGPN